MSFKKRWIVSLLIGLGIYSAASLSQASNVPVIDESMRMESDGDATRPAVDIKSSSDSYDEEAPKPRSASLEQRVTRLEKQMVARNQADGSSQIDELKQEIADLRNQVETLSHQLQVQKQAAAAAPAVAPVTPAAPVESNDPKELAAYQKGYDAIKSKDFDGAKTAFQAYLQQYKTGVYSGNAHYWLGEIYLHQNALSKAMNEFTLVVNNSKNPKYPEAMLKIGFIYYQQQNWEQARKQLNAVKVQFPNTTVASLASAKIQEMSQQGH